LLDGASVQDWLKKALPVENRRKLSRLTLRAAGRKALTPNSRSLVVSPPGWSSPSSSGEPLEPEHAWQIASESNTHRGALAWAGLAARGGRRLISMLYPSGGRVGDARQPIQPEGLFQDRPLLEERHGQRVDARIAVGVAHGDLLVEGRQ